MDNQKNLVVPNLKIGPYSCFSTHLGKGYTSIVLRGKDERDGSFVAVKVVYLQNIKSTGTELLLNQEIELLKSFNHPNILSFRDIIMDQKNCYIVTEYCEGRDLSVLLSRRGRLSWQQALALLHPVCFAVLYLQDLGIIHRDIKPSNILLQKECPKLGDFGFAKKIVSDEEKMRVGTPVYMSPEVLFFRKYSFASDIWSLGVLLYELIEGHDPWQARNQPELRLALLKPIHFRNLLNSKVKQIINGCLTYKLSDRWDINKLINQIEITLPYSSGANKIAVNQMFRGHQSKVTKEKNFNNCQ